MSETHLTITTYSHHFEVSQLSPRGRSMCMQHATKWTEVLWQKSRGHHVRTWGKVYAAATKDRQEFRFHINQLEQFNELLRSNQLTENLVHRVHVPVPESAIAHMTMDPAKVPLVHQEPSLEYLAEPLPVSKLIGLQTGKGKGFVSLHNAALFGNRTVIIVKPSYMIKWFEEILEYMPDVEGEDIMMVQGGTNLKALLALAQSDQLDCKFIIVSNKTFQGWLTDYEQWHDYSLEVGYGCKPQDFFATVKAGNRIIDELHQDWHMNFKLDLYTNVQRSVSLSATLLSKDAFTNRTYDCAYPRHLRGPELALDKYINVLPTFFRFRNPEKIRSDSKSGRGYSHDEFEKSVLRQPAVKIAYFNMCASLYEQNFLHHPRRNKTALVFCYSTEMCTAMMKYFQGRFPDGDFRRYAGSLKDPYEDLMEAQCVFSTLGSSGTAIDKPNLTYVLMTNAITSVKANVQALGRLRRLGLNDEDRVKDDNLPENQTWFSYLVCSDIPKHMEYDREKKLDFAGRAKMIRDVYTGFVL